MFRKKQKKNKEDEHFLHVRISKATELIWEGDAFSVSTKNLKGPLDILPMHANFITLLKDVAISIIDINKEEKGFHFNLAVLSVKDDTVHIYTEISTGIV
jgi:F0F1-type ATP synthase epsilon subunit